MDDGWVGRKLMLASRALWERYRDDPDNGSAAAPPVGAIAASLLREVGRSIALKEADPKLPFARARGILRLSPETSDRAVAQAVGTLSSIALDYLEHLPGSTEGQRRFARMAMGHAGRGIVVLHRLLAAGLQDPETERLFGGVAVLVFRRDARTVSLAG